MKKYGLMNQRTKKIVSLHSSASAAHAKRMSVYRKNPRSTGLIIVSGRGTIQTFKDFKKTTKKVKRYPRTSRNAFGFPSYTTKNLFGI